jgi:ribonuclease VapC
LESDIVFDASAMLAILKREPGADRALAALNRAAISCVNVAEVQTKLIEAGLDRHAAWRRIVFLGCRTFPFDENLAREAGSLIAVTRPFGLSLGDRACLALAIERKAPVYTTDREWKKLSLGIEIQVIR